MTSSFKHKTLSLVAAASAAALLAACGGGDGDTPQQQEQGWKTDANGNVTLRFAAYAGKTPVDCNSQITGVGTQPEQVLNLAQLRFYVSNVQLLKADGSKVALKLAGSGNDKFNYRDEQNAVTLIDLENKQDGNACKGTPEVNPVITGTVPAGTYTGVAFTLGVPLALNHTNQRDTATTPLVLQDAQQPVMAWAWRGGRKFTNIELVNKATSTSTLLHLGSTGCTADVVNGAAPTECGAPNRVPMRFEQFDPAKQTVAMDLAALFSTDDTSKRNGCMAGPKHADCAGPFKALALGFDAESGNGSGLPLAGQTQTVFKAIDTPAGN
ncbi:MAG: metallo-mystery pair system four-Cys motif protein [Pseudomonadota bacterium]|nr:metallo-mystery pair system four-Cys motif protein [Pseudomonadota bacterium]